MAVDLADIDQLEIKNVTSGKVECMEQLWRDQSCLVIFFRRWGCMYCRMWAKEVSKIAPVLAKNNIRLIGIGPEELGAQQFKEGKFFDGELYVDINRKVYKKIGFKRYNYLGIIRYLFSRDGWAAYQKGKDAKIESNLLQGDGLQNGGSLVIEKGGRILHSYRQQGAADQLANEKFLEVLDLSPPAPRTTDLDVDDSDISEQA